MYVRSLQLANYRNFRRLALDLVNGPIILQADNAQGKTNLLEAIELLATTRSTRTGSDRELISWAALAADDGMQERFSRVTAQVARERGDVRVDLVIRAGETVDANGQLAVSKSLRLNGLPRRAIEFVGEVNVVSFSPEDVALVGGPPSGRRRYLDVTIAQMNSRYLRSLQRFTKVLTQRNSLLRQLREERRTDGSLRVWTDELASAGAYLLQERARSVRALSELADRWFRELGGWGQRLVVRYRPGLDSASTFPEVPPRGDDALSAIQDVYLDALHHAEARERAAGMSLLGPHRDDLSFLVDSVNLNVYGSRGQQRLAALSLKLAELELLDTTVGSRPILLLDDVLSELDDHKQRAVLRTVASGGQTILTVTDPTLTTRHAIDGAQVLHIEAGAIAALASAALPDGVASEPALQTASDRHATQGATQR